MSINSTIKLEFKTGNLVSNQKINTSLGHQRLNVNDYFNVLEKKVSFFNFKKGILFTAVLLVFNNKSYALNIKMPSFSTLIKRALKVKKNFAKPGYILILNKKTPYIITPYMLFEIVKYKYNCVYYRNISLRSYFKKNLSSIKSNGVNLYINKNKNDIFKL